MELTEELKTATTAKDSEQLARQETAKDQQTEIARRRKKKPEEELRAGDSGSDYDDILGEIDSITRDDAKGNYFHEPGGDEGSYLTGSSWGHAPNITNITMWTSFDMGAITDFVIDSEDLASLLSSCSDGGLGRGSYNKEELAHSLWTGEYDHESSPGVIGDRQGERVHNINSKGEHDLENGCNGIFHVGDPCGPSRSTTVLGCV